MIKFNKIYLKERIYKLIIVVQAIGLIFIFMNISLQLQLMNQENTNRKINHEIKRQTALEKKLNCIFIRINPDEKDFNIFKEINKIHRHIKKSFKKSLIDKI